MRTAARFAPPALLAAAVCGGLVAAACAQMSEKIQDDTAGWNGGFEQDRDGLPVNWLVYTPRTVPESDFDIVLDTLEYQEGSQSLRFDVRGCKDIGGRYSPGIAQERPAQASGTYRISFWMRSDGADLKARVGGISGFAGQYETLADSEGGTNGWILVEQDYSMPLKYDRIRFEFSVLSPGHAWIDDLRIEFAGREDRQAGGLQGHREVPTGT
jgi:hypothetical protein